MKHEHHINPRHNGGTDHPSNLYECSVEEHAELHLSLYLEHGRQEDWDAFMGLSGQVGKEELFLAASSRGGQHKLSQESKDKIRQAHLGKPKHTEESKALISTARKGKKLSEEHKTKISEGGKGKHTRKGFALSNETKAKLSEAGKGNQNAKGADQKSKTEANKRRGEATKERWRKWREARGLDPNKPLSQKKK